MAEYRITYWRDIPSLVSARDDGGATAKSELPARFQEAIDEAAMRVGAVGSDEYLQGWRHGGWERREGEATDVAQSVGRELDEAYPPERLATLLDGPGEA